MLDLLFRRYKDSLRLSQTVAENIFGPWPYWRLGWGRAQSRGFLLARIRNSRRNDGCEVGRRDAMLNLKTFCWTDPFFVMSLVMDPVPEEVFFLTGQFHLAVLVRHKYTRKKVGAFLVA